MATNHTCSALQRKKKLNQHQVECGISYSQFLLIDDELGTKRGGTTVYTSENSTCTNSFHSVCLGDWLRSITTTRQLWILRWHRNAYWIGWKDSNKLMQAKKNDRWTLLLGSMV
ncbi:E3 ubiquitin-protein ligase FANCL [Artemisia annua]|uniref:E3 ubiquitin-protein ligase FANCL n=1 Tax=Artemisia annua TaxID=35608 RepID=A0A2U1L4X6_ARTAN|nr:E3 ubiquitin-protein ligase FANCL [Artemisia annua]